MADEPKDVGGEDWKQPWFVPSELNLADCFAEKYGYDFRYTCGRKTWRQYDDTRWLDDALVGLNGQLQRFLQNVAQHARSNRDRLMLGSSRTLSGVEKMLRPILCVEDDVFDRDPWLLNCPSGTFDLRAGVMREHRREDYITKMVPVNPGGACPQWLAFMDFITCTKEENKNEEDVKKGIQLADYLQRLAGYALTGDASEQMFAFLYGAGGNGKSVFVETLQHLLGDYAVSVQSSVFTAKPFEQHSEELMTMRGARLITSTEVAANAKWNEERIKMITGGERIRARNMRENSVEFEITGTLIISGNHKPGLHAVDDAIKRRMHLVPFNAKVDAKQCEENYSKRLVAEEGGGILQWMIEGCGLWQKDGMVRPELVVDETKEYIDDQDVLEQWVAELCNDFRDLKPDTISEKTNTLYSSWRIWADNNGVPSGSINQFSSRLKAIGFKRWTNGKERRFKWVILRDQRSSIDGKDTKDTYEQPQEDFSESWRH